MDGVRTIVQPHGWWLLATGAVALVVTLATGWFLFPLYAAANAAGTAMHLDGLRDRPSRRWRIVLPVLTVLMAPVGLIATLGWRRTDPLDTVLGDEDVRNHTAAANVYGTGNRHAGSG